MGKNITLAIDEALLKRARAVARRQGKSLNALVREFLQRLAGEFGDAGAAEALFDAMDAHPGRSGGWRMARDEIYEDRVG